MRAIDRKLWRTLGAMRMQAFAIALVIVGGVAVFVMSLSTLDSLFQTRESYYREHRFAHVFSSLKRAPLTLLDRIRSIPGVDRVESRVVAYVNLEVEGFPDPVSAHLLSLPDASRGLLNQIHLRRGRLFEPGRDEEVLVSESFANAHGLVPGDRIHATVNGRRRSLTIVGLALSPEYIYEIGPGAVFPDFERYGVLWMARKPLAVAYDMDGAFNDVSLTMRAGARERDVIDRLDELLRPYGGAGAYSRSDQLSNRYLSEELKQQRTIATVFPVIFLGVAAFLLHVVVSRMIELERDQIAVLKAFGYSNLAVGMHYTKLVVAIVAAGIAGGVAAGIYLGKGLTAIYAEFYKFPFTIFELDPKIVLAATAVSVLFALAGAYGAGMRAARLPPAEAMRPEPPTAYRATLLERLGLQRWFSQPTRMILRHVERHPLKSALTTLGIALACAIMMIGGFQQGAIDHMVAVQFGMSQRGDLIASFTETTSARALYSLRSLDGVAHAEGVRSVPARLRFEHRSYRTPVQGIEPDGDLLRVLDASLEPVALAERAVVLTEHLAEILRVRAGDRLTVEVLEGARPVVQVPVAGTAREYLGVNAYMRRQDLNRLLEEGDAVSGAHLRVEPAATRDVYAELRQMPRVAGVVEQRSAIRAFYDTLAETVLFFTFVSTLLGGSIAFGVVYNSMRIALSERNRELASLRVLGFHRAEVAYILLGEMALLTVLAIPLGLTIGYGLCAYLAFRFDSELYRIPLVLGTHVYAFAATVIIASAIVSGLMVWRNLGRLDMVAVLKTKE